jgi:hypothetical protein
MGTTDQNAKLQGIANSATIAGLQVQSEAQGQAANPTPAPEATPGIKVNVASVTKR